MVAGVLVPATAEDVIGHARTVDRVLSPWTTGRRLPNFAAGSDPDTIACAYDDDTWHWLSALADEHDSAGVLRVGHVVRRDH